MYSSLALPLTYSPIVIQFVPPVLVGEELDTTDFSDYWLKITPPRSNRPGLNHYLKKDIHVNIPFYGVLKLQLIPSNIFQPIGRYEVEYYQKGNTIPLTKQHWIVPDKSLQAALGILYTGNPLTLPYYVWSVNSVSPGDSFVYENNQLNVIGQTLQPGITNLTVNYQPALTLDQLIEYNVNEGF
jgi:hypothetical protein